MPEPTITTVYHLSLDPLPQWHEAEKCPPGGFAPAPPSGGQARSAVATPSWSRASFKNSSSAKTLLPSPPQGSSYLSHSYPSNASGRQAGHRIRRAYGSFSSASGLSISGASSGSSVYGGFSNTLPVPNHFPVPPSGLHGSNQVIQTTGSASQTLTLVVRGRGLARTPLDDEHLIENIKDTDLLNRTYGHNIQTALESHRDSPCSSGQSSPTIIEAPSPVSQSYWGWTTGNTTDRSSPDSSYCLDDFDRKAATKVQQHFEEIQSMLFEGPRENLTQQAEVVKECGDWSSQFPHLRILGKQASTSGSKDTGYHIIETSQELRPAASSYLLDISSSDSSLGSDAHGLVLTGRSVSANRIPSHEGQSSEFSQLAEEVIEEEGVYEDIIAVDYKNSYEDNMEFKKQITPRKRRVGYPPITPSACVKDSVTSAAFDHIWQEILSWMRPLVIKYSSLITDSKHDILTLSPTENHPSLPSMTIHNNLPNSRQNSFYRSNTYIGGSTERSFDGILQISSIPLMHRAGDLPEPHGPTLLGPTLGGPQMRPTNHARGLRKGRLLAPIPSKFTSEDERPSRYSALDALKVKKLTPNANESSPSPPSRHGTLPPLDDVRPQKKFQPGNRAASAIDNKESRLFPYKEKTHLYTEPARPNTTHAMMYDSHFVGSSLRRSSTPLAHSLLTRNNSLVNKSLDIRGLQPASDAIHGHSHPDIQEDQQESPQEGGEEESGYSPHWTVSQPTSYGRSRLTLK